MEEAGEVCTKMTCYAVWVLVAPRLDARTLVALRGVHADARLPMPGLGLRTLFLRLRVGRVHRVICIPSPLPLTMETDSGLGWVPTREPVLRHTRCPMGRILVKNFRHHFISGSVCVMSAWGRDAMVRCRKVSEHFSLSALVAMDDGTICCLNESHVLSTAHCNVNARYNMTRWEERLWMKFHVRNAEVGVTACFLANCETVGLVECGVPIRR